MLFDLGQGRSGPVQAVVQVLQQAAVDGRKRGDVGQGDVLVDFVDAGVGRAQLDDFGADLGDEAPVAGAAAPTAVHRSTERPDWRGRQRGSDPLTAEVRAPRSRPRRRRTRSEGQR